MGHMPSVASSHLRPHPHAFIVVLTLPCYSLHVCLPCSCLEIFTGSGEVLSTRLYRGASPHGHTDAGIEFVALDGEATIERVAAYDMASIWLDQEQQAAAAAAAAAAEALEGLDLDLLSNATAAEQQQVEKALSLSHSLGSRATTLSLSSSLKEAGMFGPLSPALSGKMQQLLLSPRATTAAAAAAAVAMQQQQVAAGGGYGGYLQQQQHELHELPLEEEMTADIFNLE